MRALFPALRNRATQRSWAHRIRPYSTSNAITAANLFSRFNFIKSKTELARLLDQKDIVLHNSENSQMPEGVTDISLEKVINEDKDSSIQISIYFSGPEGVKAYKRFAKELSGNEDVKLQNTFSLGFAKISMDLDTFLRKIESNQQDQELKYLTAPQR